MNLYASGDTVLLSLLLEDGDVTKFPRAYVYLGGSLETTTDLSHVAQGRYTGNWNPATNGPYNVVYLVFSDAGRTVIDISFSREQENWKAMDALTQPIVDGVLDESLAGHTTAGTVGDALNRIPTSPASSRERVVQGYSYNHNTNVFTGVFWLETDGQLNTSVTNGSVTFYDDQGNSLFTDIDAAPDGQGIFRMSRGNPGFSADDLVYAVASITVPGPRTITTVKAGVAIG